MRNNVTFKDFNYDLEDLVRAYFKCSEKGLTELRQPITNRIYDMLRDSSVDEFQDDGYENEIVTLVLSLDIDVVIMEEINRQYDDVNEGPVDSVWYKTYRADGNHLENRLTHDTLMATAQEIVSYGNLALSPYFDFKE